MEQKIRFVHTHVHTDASPDGLCTVDRLVARAAELEYTALAMTDHGTLANAVSFWSACKDHHIKPIFGIEGYMLWNGKRHHITLNSLTRTGFNNIIALSNAAQANTVSGYPVMTVDMMAEHSKDVALFTGCPASPIHQGSFADGLNFAGTMRSIYGENMWAELMFVISDDVTSRPLQIAKDLNLPILVTNDVHYPLQSMQRAHTILTECRKGFSYDSNQLWLKNVDEMLYQGRRFFDDDLVQKWMMEAALFGDRVESWSMAAEPSLPKARELFDHFYRKLHDRLVDNMARYPEAKAIERMHRYEYELKVLEDMGFVDYFCILDNIVEWAHEQGILIGPGRGSAAGSYVLYLLGITDIDPIEHGLYFERFLNPQRKEYPDVDVDIESDRRHEVIEYATKRWGACPIATYSHYSHKSLVNDIARVLRISSDLAEPAGEFGPDSKDFEQFAASNPDVLPAYNAIIGQMRHAGKHAGGVVITDQPIPLENVSGTLVAAWTEGYTKQLSKVGVVKYDILGLTALSQIKMMRKMAGINGAPPHFDHPEVYDLFCSGDVLGIFQWTGSDGIRTLTVDIQPREFVELAIINSLYRPGAIDAGTAWDYPKYKISPRLIHPKIDEILAETYGVIVFQEQFMQIFAAVTGGGFAESDLIRRVIVKPRPEDPEWNKKFAAIHTDFLEKGVANGYPNEILVQLWAEINTHTRYSFNKAHSAAYAAVAYEMAWYKVFYPSIFYSAMLKYDLDNTQTYLLEAASKGITVMMPSINESTEEYRVMPSGNLLMPLNIINYLSENGTAKILAERAKGPFVSLEDFRNRIKKRDVTTRTAKYLFLAGAFNGLPGDPKCLFEADDEELTRGQIEIMVFGFRLPNAAIAKFLTEERPDRQERGFVHHWKDKPKKKGTGTYRVYYLRPSGTFWVDDEELMRKVREGDLLKADKNSWGKAARQNVKRINIE